MKNYSNNTSKIPVTFYHRKPVKAFNHSVEFIFEDVRKRLVNLVAAKVHYSKYKSQGIFLRMINCLDVLFYQSSVNHITGDINYIGLFLSKDKTIHTILDCIYLKTSKGIKHAILKFFWLTIPVKKSIYITAISEATKQEILRYSNCNPDKIFVIPVAISDKFKQSRKSFNSDKPVLLQVGITPNKNIARLAEALRGINCKLNIIGRRSSEMEDILNKHGVDFTVFTGLSDEEIIVKYREADVLAFVSTYEGFGMPILEAQAIGRPVVTSKVASMPEVSGGAACLVDPFDVQSIRQGITKVISDGSYREALIAKGFENIKRFNADKIAMEYFNLYKKIAG